MKVVKPLKLGILHRSFEYRSRCFWAPTVLAFFDFEDGQAPKLSTEIDMWTFCADELGKAAVVDEGMPKERGEVLVHGAFHAPGGQPVPAGRVRLRLGGIDKTLFVFGDRHWRRNFHLVADISAPVPATRIPITYANAFGGPRFKANPLGKGLPPETEAGAGAAIALPNVEHPDHLLGSLRDRPEPAGFAPLDPMWPQRYHKCGTYDEQWYRERFPGLADDIDWTFFNTAPEDQQIEGFFNGDEPFLIEGMHPRMQRIEGRLPDLRPRCFINRRGQGEQTFEEVSLQLDTLWLFPHAQRGILVYHGLVPSDSDTAREIDHLLIAYEAGRDPRRDLMHYHAALHRRLDKENGALALLDETDLIAAGERSGYTEMMASESVAAMRGEGLLQAKQKERMDRDLAAVRALIAAQGSDPDQVLPLPVANEPGDGDLDFDHILTQAQDQRKAADERLAAQLQNLGLDKETLLQQAATEPAPRPTFTAAEAVATFRSLGVNDPDLENKMALMETGFQRAYRQAGHALPPILSAPDHLPEQRRQALLDAHGAGKHSPDKDLAGIDLSDADLPGIDLAGALLEDARLHGTRLTKAELTEIALMRSDLSGADLSGACLKGAGMGRACLAKADLTGADLSGAALVAADLGKTVLRGANLEEADLSEVKAGGADFSDARMSAVRLLEADLSKACLEGADLRKALLYKTRLTGAVLDRCRLEEAVLVEVEAAGCRFRGAQMANLRAAFQCTLTGADFSDADLRGCNFRGADLTGACFAGADLTGADLSEAVLKDCNFVRANASGCLFMDADLTNADLQAANLFESLLHRATLFDTRFTGANLYGADFMKARFRNTDVRLALQDRSTLNRWAPR
ncbi:DUF2169 family type VI secretion system accessory protein [Desulfatitalea alkaliphila]|uniref:DUF2169 domain-containing protein n=1 Tax=Desulfatitalea alkaliphila TaxID=2929485 RepID=A0AA41R625_9BACT|nr:DUF2169 domain-containing protein [Desulfatitalea alkaliphila]MCJ8501785.1 DUF2169 domain-containing protein [Desulfatitalea alkaliphila]